MKIIVDEMPKFPSSCLFSRSVNGLAICDLCSRQNSRCNNTSSCSKLITLEKLMLLQEQSTDSYCVQIPEEDRG